MKFFFGILCVVYILCGMWASDGAVVTPKRLRCEYYDPKECEDEDNCKVKEKECEDTDPDKPNHCFVVWKTDNTTGKFNITLKGCFTDNIACDQTECIDNTAELKKSLNFCCCKESMCNTAHKWIPTTTKATEIEVPQEPEVNSGLIALAISLSLGFIILAIIIIYFVCKRNKRGMFNEIPTCEPEMTNSSPCLALRPIQLLEMKARGRFGAVWRAQMKPDEVAVKIFPVQDKDSWASEHEIYKLARMKHPNILEFIGAEKHTESIQHEFWLITAYHNNGSLCDYLKAYTVTWAELCRISESMARGLMHLHEEIASSKTDGLKPAIAHRDFKSKNVLLKNDLTACIADFGLALVFNPGKPCGDTHGQVGTRRYMAPEVLEGAINFTRDAFLRIDVYACGLVLWELVSRCTVNTGNVPPYALPFESELGLHPSLEEMQENVVMKKLRPKIEDSWRAHSGLNAICDTIEESWDHDAEARLSSSCVMERIAQHTRYPITHLLIETNTDTSIKDSTDSM